MKILLPLVLVFACSESAPSEGTPEGQPNPAEAGDKQPGPNDATGDANATQTPLTGQGQAKAGPFAVNPIMHGTAVIQVDGKHWWIDPWSEAPLDDKPKADVVLITDVHFDHLDPKALDTVKQEGTVFVAPKAVADKWEGKVDHVLANGESVTIDGITIEAVPMYNLVRGPEEGTLFHDKGRGNGYILSSGDTRVYFAGDTECTDEMKALRDIDLAFVPMNLPYTMPPAEAAACVKAFKPATVVPYHYKDSDPAEFAQALAGVDGVAVQHLEFYPGGATEPVPEHK